jgi:hypothetical protein
LGAHCAFKRAQSDAERGKESKREQLSAAAPAINSRKDNSDSCSSSPFVGNIYISDDGDSDGNGILHMLLNYAL